MIIKVDNDSKLLMKQFYQIIYKELKRRGYNTAMDKVYFDTIFEFETSKQKSDYNYMSICKYIRNNSYYKKIYNDTHELYGIDSKINEIIIKFFNKIKKFKYKCLISDGEGKIFRYNNEVVECIYLSYNIYNEKGEFNINFINTLNKYKLNSKTDIKYGYNLEKIFK